MYQEPRSRSREHLTVEAVMGAHARGERVVLLVPTQEARDGLLRRWPGLPAEVVHVSRPRQY